MIDDDRATETHRSNRFDAAVATVLCDLDGVVWLARIAIEGAVEAVEALRDSGRRVLFVTNNSAPLRHEHEAALGAIGIGAQGDVVTSAMAVAGLVEAGSRVLICGGGGVFEALAQREVDAIAVAESGSGVPRDLDAVVVGIDREFNYERLRRAAAAIRSGARFLATNDDATYPTGDGQIPGAGAIVAAVAVASGCAPTIAGKPHPPMVDVVARLLGADFDPSTTLMVGDRPSTDGAFAEALGARFALVRSGVTPQGARPGGPTPWLDEADLAGVAGALRALDQG